MIWAKEKNCVVPPLPHSIELQIVCFFFFLMRLTREKRFLREGKGDKITELNLNFLIRKKATQSILRIDARSYQFRKMSLVAAEQKN